MATNVIPGGDAFSFGALALHGNLQQIIATDEQQVARHRVLKRDGEILEGMGWQANIYEAHVVLVGPNFRADAERIRNAIRRKSEDVLVHPLYGRVTARCNRIAGALNIPAEVNSVTLTLSFIESGLDPNQSATLAQSVNATSQALAAASDDYELLAAPYTSTDATTATTNLTASATDYAAAALYAAQTGTPDPSLSAQVGAIEAQVHVAIAAIQADTASSYDVDRFDALSAADLVYAAALAVEDALNQLRPAIVPFVVPASMSYLTLLNSLYGVTALDREADFALYNASITTPHLIPAGTTVYLPAATV